MCWIGESEVGEELGRGTTGQGRGKESDSKGLERNEIYFAERTGWGEVYDIIRFLVLFFSAHSCEMTETRYMHVYAALHLDRVSIAAWTFFTMFGIHHFESMDAWGIVFILRYIVGLVAAIQICDLMLESDVMAIFSDFVT